MSQVEILSPAGSPTSLHAAVNAGADAVYVGGNMFSARAFANNFDCGQLQEALDFVHIHNRKLYLTVNTLLKNSEIKSALYDFIKPAYENGLDAVLVQDFGVFEFIRKHFPDLDIHASTQMTTNGEFSARFLEQKGVTRVVTSREVSLEEIRRIRETTNVEIESFVHGALCYSYSGQCLMSSIIGGRSGNRGRCAQSCRLPYTVYDENRNICGKKDSHVLSPKDICTLEILPDIIEAGVYSLKIEGRMKSPEYAAGVVSIYRKYVDMYLKNGKDKYKVDQNDTMALMDLFNRGNFTKGYYMVGNGPKMMSMERPNHQGTKAIEVVSTKKGLMSVKALNVLNPQDIVDVSPEFTWTNGTARRINEVFDIRIPANLKVNKGDIYYRVRNNTLLGSIDEKYLKQDIRESISITAEFKADSKAFVVAKCRDKSVMVYGNVVSKALNRPMTKEQIEEQMGKLGNTEYIASNVDVDVEDGIFVSVQELKALKREMVDKLTEALVVRRNVPVCNGDYVACDATNVDKSVLKADLRDDLSNASTTSDTTINVVIKDLKQLEKVSKYHEVNRVSFEFVDGDFNKLEEVSKSIKAYGFESFLAFPHIFRKNTADKFINNMDKLKKANFDGFLIRNLDELQFVIENNLNGKRILDYNLYQFNDYSEGFFKECEIDTYTASYELSRNELFNMDNSNQELVVYGRIPLMLSAQCVMKNLNGCMNPVRDNTNSEALKKPAGMLWLKDRMGKTMPVENRCAWCYNVIYDSAPLDLTEYGKIIMENNFKSVRVDLSLTDYSEIDCVMNAFVAAFRNDSENMLSKESFSGKVSESNHNRDYTKGHFLRGVE